MALFKVFRGTSANLPSTIHDGYAYLTTDDGKFYIDTTQRRILINPTPASSASDVTYIKDDIVTNVGVVLDYLLDSSATIDIHTTAEWNGEAGRAISEKNTFYVYSDGYTLADGTVIPRIKLGDGMAYIIDLPFLDEKYYSHIRDASIHVTPEEKAFWNTKLVCMERAGDEQVLFDYITFGQE